MSKYICMVCGYEYDEAKGIPEAGIAAGTKWEDLPLDWVCPLCGAPKSQFEKSLQKEKDNKDKTLLAKNDGQAIKLQSSITNRSIDSKGEDELRQLSDIEKSILCSNLARGCEKQYMARESELFTELANYFSSKIDLPSDASFSSIAEQIRDDLNTSFVVAKDSAEELDDRGAKRALTWSEKVSRMLLSVIDQYNDKGELLIKDTKIWVCDICGYVYVGEEPPAVCPVCKVPRHKIMEVKRVSEQNTQ